MVVPTRGMNHYLQNLAYRALIGTAMSLPYARRVPFAGRAVSHIAGAAGWRKRIRDNLALVFPEMPECRVAELVREVPDNVGGALTGIWSSREFRARGTPLTGGWVATPERASTGTARSSRSPAISDSETTTRRERPGQAELPGLRAVYPEGQRVYFQRPSPGGDRRHRDDGIQADPVRVCPRQ